jgi:hypothetical protein
MGVCNVLLTGCEATLESLCFSDFKNNGRVGDFQVATGGGFWVAIRGGFCNEFREYFTMTKDGRLLVNKVEWSERNNEKYESMCGKITGIPRDKKTTYLGYAFYNMGESKFPKFVRKKVKIIKEEELKGHLDERERGLGGTPYTKRMP